MFIVDVLKHPLGLFRGVKNVEIAESSASAVDCNEEKELTVCKSPPVQVGSTFEILGHDANPTSSTTTVLASGNATETKNECNIINDITNKIGRITILDNHLTRGVVDNKYYFNKSDWSNLKLKRLQQVNYSAVYRHSSAEWWITNLEPYLTEEQLVVIERSKYRTVTCKVKEIHESYIIVRSGTDESNCVTLNLPKELLPKDYVVRKGDWLAVKLKAGDHKETSGDIDLSSATPVNVKWTEQKVTVGCVMKYRDQLCIDGIISFCQDDVENQVNLCPGYKVRVVSVSSDQGGFPHRACSVFWIKTKGKTKGLQYNSDEDTPTSIAKEEEFDILFLDKCGVRITPRRFISFRPVKIGMSSDTLVTIQNTGNEAVILERVNIGTFQDVCKFQLLFEGTSKEVCDGRMIAITPGMPFTFKISSSPIQLGRTRELCLFDFGTFQIGRWLSVTALANDDEAIVAIKRHERGKKGEHWKATREEALKTAKALREKNLRTVRGPSAIKAPFFIANKIPGNPVPRDLYLIFKNEDTKSLEAKYPGVNWFTLDATNYRERFHVALWFEEAENDVLRRQYDMRDIVLESHGDEFMLRVPNLKEFYPPVLLKDPVQCHEPDSQQKLQLLGHISRLVYPDGESPQVYLKFHPDFHSSYSGQSVTIQFCSGRNTYRRAHFAVDQAMEHLGPDWLFPQSVVVKAPRIQFYEDDDDNFHPPVTNKKVLEQANVRGSGSSPTMRENGEDVRHKSIFRHESNVQKPSNLWSMKLRWFNPALNEEQKDAVRRILRGQGRPLPYILFGPPGTGKTVTIVEAILQVYFIERSSRILITVPSNAGADIIAEALVATNRFVPGDFVRLNGFSRAEIPVPESIAGFCVDGENLESVARHRLIISTVATAGQFFQLHLNTGHFSHVFVDEAGYCMEPEALIAAVLTAINKEGQVILAGDPKQLGPVLMCDIGVNEILTKSLLERLMETPIYSRDESTFPETKYNPVVLTKLIRCYRAHKTLLKLPSELFYANELVSHASYEDAYELSEKLDFLPKKGVPLIFHGIQGTCFKDVDSPSYYNLAEIGQVVHYVKQLKNSGVPNKDIGVITPYRKQVDKIKLSLQCTLHEDDIPKVASVEEFQGGERKVMIISTVRTEYTDLIRKKFKGNKLSFIFSKKRFNVAVTRAKALMIVIGDPHVLFKDDGEIKCWSRLLRFASDAGVYVGCDKPIQLEPKLQQFANHILPSAPAPRRKQDDVSGGNNADSTQTLPALVNGSSKTMAVATLADTDSLSSSNDNGSGCSANGNGDDSEDEEPEEGYAPARTNYYSRF